MAAKYWVGDFFVDLTRNQITQKMDSKTIPPKALAVLTCLAKNANSVVSHDQILSEVWPDTVVTPNTLQRSIAQLRKALGEDSQYQSYIKTHAKQGYSLEVEVRWQENTNQASDSEPESFIITESRINKDSTLPEAGNQAQASTQSLDAVKEGGVQRKSNFKLVWYFLGFAIVGLIATAVFSPKHPPVLTIGEIRSLTNSDNKELASIYSPDGQYVVFHRYSEEFCLNNIWAKNIDTQEEIQLTNRYDSYGSHSFSKDGNKLVFVQSGNCNQPITQKTCYKLMSLDFNKALQSPQSAEELLECKNSRIRNPKWLNNNDISLFQKQTDRWKLVIYSIKDNKTDVIYEIEDGILLDYEYSAKDDLFALTSIHADGLTYIEILNSNGQILSSNELQRLPEIAKFKSIYPNFMPNREQLIFSTGRQLFTLSFDGKVSNISIPLDEPMGSPKFHPTEKRMLAIKGHYDSDIGTIPLASLVATNNDESINSNVDKSVLELSILERSNQGEDNGQFQPKGELIAFKSERSGEDQVWISSGSNARPISNFPVDTSIFGMDWAADGKSLLVNVDKELVQVFLDSSTKAIDFDLPVLQLYQWNSLANTALVLARIKGVSKLVELNLDNSEYTLITDKQVKWARITDAGQLIYTDSNDRFWKPGPAEDQLIEKLEFQGSERRFVINNKTIYGINEGLQLWSYNLQSDAYEVLGKLPNDIDYITDVNRENLLLSVKVAARKEVVELTYTD
jgi:transcriptional activator of cad operon